MASRLLDPAERQRFIQYCRENAQSCDALARQLEGMPHVDAVVRHNRMRAMAYTVVANDLDSAEDMTLSS